MIYLWCGIGAHDDAGLVAASAIDAAPDGHPSTSARWTGHRQDEVVTYNTTSVQWVCMGAGDVTDPGEELRHALRLLGRHLLVGYEGDCDCGLWTVKYT